jgi:hypothetical protein
VRVKGKATKKREEKGMVEGAYRLSSKTKHRRRGRMAKGDLEVDAGVTKFRLDGELTPDFDDEIGGVFVKDL